MGNWFKTTLLLGVMTVLIVWVGHLLGGQQGMIFAFAIAMAMNFFSYWYSHKIVLKMYRARPVTAEEHPELHDLVQHLAERAGLPMPGIYIIPGESPNAFAAFGRANRTSLRQAARPVGVDVDRHENEG